MRAAAIRMIVNTTPIIYTLSKHFVAPRRCVLLPCVAGNLREINRHLPYYCPECLQLANQPIDVPEPPNVPQTAEVGSGRVEPEYTPFIKTLCAPIYEYKQKHVSNDWSYLIDSSSALQVWNADRLLQMLFVCCSRSPASPHPCCLTLSSSKTGHQTQ